MVLTIEPGLYRTPVGGARIEDEVLVTETGFEVFTKLERRWWAA
jgi:Xaa-Pro aminopeptidase